MERKKREVHEIGEAEIKNNIGDIEANKIQFNFSVRLNELLMQKGISQQELSENTKIAMSSISSYRNGKAEPQITSFEKIAETLKVSADYLLGRSENKTVNPTIQSACEYTHLSEKAVEKLNQYSTDDDKEKLEVNVLSYLISNGFIDRIVTMLTDSLISTYQFGLIYNQRSENNEKESIFNSEEFRFSQEMISIYKWIHRELGITFLNQIQHLTAKKINALVETAKITKLKMDEIIDNLDTANASSNTQAAYVYKLINDYKINGRQEES